ncbi:hypothetical protein GCM10010275_29140 [Streptomyces litmocidini]|uniref:hypothetical protein n=1 Tax=Streptomyces litmocidini TaxID=67318 RepID=UPI00167CAF57|nr:hypothetical protein [Streptomyces litmocidini]GGU90474.1 hypothetical protein GCM10010275_29140 [Streptomyces litmocidini]
MSASDQDTPTAETPEADEPGKAEEAQETTESPEVREEPEESGGPDGADDDSSEDAEEAAHGGGLTPKQARRLRVAAASVLLVALAVVLVVRLASRTSVLVVGVYGLAMILCGIVIELSRNGRTRLGTWLLAGGLLTALALDWLVLP